MNESVLANKLGKGTILRIVRNSAPGEFKSHTRSFNYLRPCFQRLPHNILSGPAGVVGGPPRTSFLETKPSKTHQ